MSRNDEVVCSSDEARQYFKDKGLTYADVKEGDILVLVMNLNKEIKKSNKTGETSTDTMHLSKKVNMKKNRDGSIVSCYLYMNSHYFTQRETIIFHKSGFIGFAGWADQGNTNPIYRAFLKWCDYLAESEEEDGQRSDDI